VATTRHKVQWQHKQYSSQLSNQVGKSTRELNRKPQQYSTNYLYILSIVHAILYAYPNVHTLSSYPLLIHYASTSRPVCHIHVPWCHTLNPTLNLHHPCMHHIYTIRNHIFWHHTLSRLFPILLDPKSI